MEITINTLLKKANSDMTAKVIKVDNEHKTAIVEFEDGSNTIYSFSTLKDKRRFTLVENEEDKYVSEIMEQKKELGIEVLEIKSYEVVEETTSEEPEKSRKPRITITFQGETKTPGEWAEKFGMDAKKIRLALRKGKTPEEIFNGKNN